VLGSIPSYGYSLDSIENRKAGREEYESSRPAQVVSFIILSHFLCSWWLSILADALMSGCNGNNKKGMIMQSQMGYFPSYPRDAY
jgi:hypothetical protein